MDVLRIVWEIVVGIFITFPCPPETEKMDHTWGQRK